MWPCPVAARQRLARPGAQRALECGRAVAAFASASLLGGGRCGERRSPPAGVVAQPLLAVQAKPHRQECLCHGPRRPCRRGGQARGLPLLRSGGFIPPAARS